MQAEIGNNEFSWSGLLLLAALLSQKFYHFFLLLYAITWYSVIPDYHHTTILHISSVNSQISIYL